MKKHPLFFFGWLLAFALPSAAQQKHLSLNDIYGTAAFQAREVPGFRSMADGRYYTEISADGDLLKKSFASGETIDTLVRATDLRTASGRYISLSGYDFSRDEKKLLILTDKTPIYRRSYTTIPFVYDLAEKKLSPVAATPVLHPTFSPDGNKVAYVRDNNLYVKNLTSGKVTQITFDGKHNQIINGNCDWVYEEEFSFTKAYAWSPYGDQIAYYRFDESNVPDYTLFFYTDTSVYPIPYTYKYPKAGAPNSIVTIHVYNLQTGEQQSMDIGNNTDQYIPRIKWTQDNETLCIYRLNRLQNKLELLLSDSPTGNSRVIYTDSVRWYISEPLYDDLFFLNDNQHFIIVNESDGWQHAYLYTMQGRLQRKLTPGNFDIDQVAGIDQQKGKFYFTAAWPDAMNRQLFVTDLKGNHREQLTHRPGWHSVSFNADYTFYLEEYSNLHTPPVYTICDPEGRAVRLLEDNAGLKKRMQSYALSSGRFLQIPNQAGVELNAMMLYPPDFDSTRQYPVLFMNYGGPGSQTVVNQWEGFSFWQQLLAEKGYIIISVDNQGTGFRGAAFKKAKTYMQLGWQEIHDQMDAAKWLVHHFSYVDSARIGHWGWSFGGFMSGLAITVGASVFHAAVAVAPVTNWRYYDNIYTERFMRRPEDNPEGYRKTTLARYADRLQGPFLLIHGTADDNVHFQNSLMFSEALIQSNKQFQQAYYPNKNHGIYGGKTRLQLYRRMTDFILANL